MAVSIKTEHEVKRTDMFGVDPFDIVVKEELRGRWEAPTEKEILDMAMSLMTHGQRQPVEVRKQPDKRPVLTLGFTRTAAARLIRTGFKDTDGVDQKDENFILKCIVSDADEEQAFFHNIVENAHRNATSHIDDAHNQAKMRDKYMKSNAEIAKIYRITEDWVGRLQRILMLPKEIQMMIHLKKMPMGAGLDLLDLPEEKQKSAIEAAVKSNGKVDGTVIREQVRDHLLNDEEKEKALAQVANNGVPTQTEENGKGKGGSRAYKKRSMSDLRKYLKAKEEDHPDDAVKAFAKTLGLWMDGARKDETLDKAVETLLDAKRT